ncbi:44 kDa protein [Donkey orchid symptomless virus]|uniref:44 kDa protein n=1 Tax=Donkey orchid symptomless virus TaxID=1400526 RepID=V5LVJ6_9VIRU|nr:44 kDa protein [Donkey orchid symptomless virus]AHA56695.1 44 kDa protein [Donkey orchid symptomless virus]
MSLALCRQSCHSCYVFQFFEFQMAIINPVTSVRWAQMLNNHTRASPKVAHFQNGSDCWAPLNFDERIYVDLQTGSSFQSSIPVFKTTSTDNVALLIFAAAYDRRADGPFHLLGTDNNGYLYTLPSGGTRAIKVLDSFRITVRPLEQPYVDAKLYHYSVSDNFPLSEGQARIRELTIQVETLTSTNEDLTRLNTTYSSRIDSLQKDNDRVSAANSTLSDEKSACFSKLAQATDVIRQLRETNALALGQIGELSSLNEVLGSKNDDLTEAQRLLETSLAVIETKNRELTVEVAELKAKLEACKPTSISPLPLTHPALGVNHLYCWFRHAGTQLKRRARTDLPTMSNYIVASRIERFAELTLIEVALLVDNTAIKIASVTTTGSIISTPQVDSLICLHLGICFC